MDAILVDEIGYKQFLEELSCLKQLLENNAANGSEAYKDAVGDGWHDNFAFEEVMRNERNIAARINAMLKNKTRLKIVSKSSDKSVIDIGDILKIKVCYSDGDIEIYDIVLTGKYLPETESEIQEISLNSPIGKALYLKKETDDIICSINNNLIKIVVLEKR